MDSLLKEIRACTICARHLPQKPRPILNFSKSAKVLIVGQAPGIKAHESLTPWNDASGSRLRDWLGVTKEQFYDETLFAIVPMGFCYPGKGKSGDLPPRTECSKAWMEKILDRLHAIELKILIGSYSQEYFLKVKNGQLTETVKEWRKSPKDVICLPHPSPRNNIWLKKNPWFEKEIVPVLKNKVQLIL